MELKYHGDGDLVDNITDTHLPGLESFIKWEPVDPSLPFKPPFRKFDGDAGFDLFCSEDVTISPGRFATIPTNIRIALPDRVWCILFARSSTAQRGMIVTNGIIDSGWRGPLFATVYNGTDCPVGVKTGDRLVQMVLFNLITPPLVRVAKLPPGDRGELGFGSTGR